jgi:hypothetical protein
VRNMQLIQCDNHGLIDDLFLSRVDWFFLMLRLDGSLDGDVVEALAFEG